MAFIFGGDTGTSYESLQQRRKIADAMMARSVAGTPRNVGEGLTSIGNAIAGKILDRRVGRKEDAAREEANSVFNSLMGGMSPDPMASGGQPAPVPPVAEGPITPNPQGLPQGVIDAVDRVDPQGGVSAEAIRQGLIARGLPEHIADGFVMNFQDESGLNPGINEIEPLVPGSRGGFGLAQWTGPRRKALEEFAAQNGKSASDPSVQMDFLVMELQGPESAAWSNIAGAKDAGSAGAAIVNHFLRPAEEHRASRAQRYTGGQQTPMGDQQGGIDPRIMKALSNPYMSDSQKTVLNALLGQQMQAQDPMRQTQLQLAQAELAQMQNPQPGYEQITGADLGLQGELAGALFNRGPDGKITQIGGGGTNVNVNTGNGPDLGKLSTDYGYVLDPQTGKPVVDPQTGLPKAAPVPGSPAALEIEQAAKASENQAELAGRAGNVVIEDIGRALNIIETGGPVSGLVGSGLKKIPGTDSYDTSQLLLTIKSNLGFDRLQQMREASPTGGALGQVSNQELNTLQAVLGSLEQEQSEEQLTYNLNRLNEIYSEILKKASAYPNAGQFGFGGNAPDTGTPQDGGRRLKFNPETGGLE
jgi:hypothetical protein